MNIRVLLIEADHSYADLVRTCLEGGTCEVRTAPTLADAVGALGTDDDIDVVLLDLDVAGTEGLDAIERLRSEFTRLPIVVVSSHGDFEVGLQAIRRGAQEFLLKGHAEQLLLPRAVRYAVERKRMQDFEQLIIGVVGHDLRQPLQTVSIGTTLLAHEASLSKNGRATIERLARAVRHAETLVHDLLDLTRIKVAGRLPIERDTIELVAVVAHVVRELRALYPERTVMFEAPDPIHGQWDRGRIEQVLNNLIANALQHSPANARVQIAISAQPDCAYISIHNEGPPIPTHVLAHVFEPLARSDPGDTSRPGSVGLGLFIADQIVRAHGGQIVIESSDDAGTTFRIELPRAREEECPPTEDTRSTIAR